jgi:hypothetical protein
MKTYGEMDAQTHVSLTLASVEGEWSASRPCRFTPGEKVPGTHWIRGWVDPRAGLDDMEMWKFLTLPKQELRSLCRPTRSQSLYRLLYRNFPTDTTGIKFPYPLPRVPKTQTKVPDNDKFLKHNSFHNSFKAMNVLWTGCGIPVLPGCVWESVSIW